MAEDVQKVTQQMLRKWHESNFPGLTDAERVVRIGGKFIEESEELKEALWDNLTSPGTSTREALKEELADVMIVLMGLAEFAGINVTVEAIKKFNIINNRVFEPMEPDENGRPRWRRIKDGRPEQIKDLMNREGRA